MMTNLVFAQTMPRRISPSPGTPRTMLLEASLANGRRPATTPAYSLRLLILPQQKCLKLRENRCVCPGVTGDLPLQRNRRQPAFGARRQPFLLDPRQHLGVQSSVLHCHSHVTRCRQANEAILSNIRVHAPPSHHGFRIPVDGLLYDFHRSGAQGLGKSSSHLQESSDSVMGLLCKFAICHLRSPLCTSRMDSRDKCGHIFHKKLVIDPTANTYSRSPIFTTGPKFLLRPGLPS